MAERMRNGGRGWAGGERYLGARLHDCLPPLTNALRHSSQILVNTAMVSRRQPFFFFLHLPPDLSCSSTSSHLPLPILSLLSLSTVVVASWIKVAVLLGSLEPLLVTVTDGGARPRDLSTAVSCHPSVPLRTSDSSFPFTQSATYPIDSYRASASATIIFHFYLACLR